MVAETPASCHLRVLRSSWSGATSSDAPMFLLQSYRGARLVPACPTDAKAKPPLGRWCWVWTVFQEPSGAQARPELGFGCLGIGVVQRLTVRPYVGRLTFRGLVAPSVRRKALMLIVLLPRSSFFHGLVTRPFGTEPLLSKSVEMSHSVTHCAPALKGSPFPGLPDTYVQSPWEGHCSGDSHFCAGVRNSAVGRLTQEPCGVLSPPPGCIYCSSKLGLSTGTK